MWLRDLCQEVVGKLVSKRGAGSCKVVFEGRVVVEGWGLVVVVG